MTITQKEKEIALDIINTLMEKGFAKILEGRSCCGLYDFTKESFGGDYHITFFHGSTRLVIVCSELDNWVIKVNYYGSKDYCQIEADLFKEVLAQGLQYYFAETYFLETVEGHNFYIQERLEIETPERDTKIFDYTSEHYVDSEECFESEDEYNLAVWSTSEELEYEDIIDALMPDGYVKVTDFVYEHDINDLHIDNYGMTNNGDFKILDYCGYYD